jgi:hypothetical protein
MRVEQGAWSTLLGVSCALPTVYELAAVCWVGGKPCPSLHGAVCLSFLYW